MFIIVSGIFCWGCKKELFIRGNTVDYSYGTAKEIMWKIQFKSGEKASTPDFVPTRAGEYQRQAAADGA